MKIKREIGVAGEGRDARALAAATFMNTPSDIKTPEDVKTLVDAFYEKVNRDELLGSCL
jgi:hypothetical protein